MKQKLLQKAGIPLPAFGLFLENITRLFDREGSLVGTFTRQGIEGVKQLKNPRKKGNLLSAKLIRVPLPIPSIILSIRK